ncbi:hypothetical protein MKZ38_000491 [Zalerion maritima]|uniref:Uncharacterized protein n=1 Tax=Zalerion maritima TaxID=339359 RepID=A0AAD5RRH8_9PEZI|nr:hypothetical protein MKZ38_000491 [Zalerion maritima]
MQLIRHHQPSIAPENLKFLNTMADEMVCAAKTFSASLLNLNFPRTFFLASTRPATTPFEPKLSVPGCQRPAPVLGALDSACTTNAVDKDVATALALARPRHPAAYQVQSHPNRYTATDTPSYGNGPYPHPTTPPLEPTAPTTSPAAAAAAAASAVRLLRNNNNNNNNNRRPPPFAAPRKTVPAYDDDDDDDDNEHARYEKGKHGAQPRQGQRLPGMSAGDGVADGARDDHGGGAEGEVAPPREKLGEEGPQAALSCPWPPPPPPQSPNMIPITFSGAARRGPRDTPHSLL